YAAVAALAEQKREEFGAEIPIVGTGHLFTAGGQTVDGDGVRELYVGSLAQVTAGIFPACFNYLALGHLHVPQKVNGLETIRYSGSPLPMGFGEAKQQKSVLMVDFGFGIADLPDNENHPIPEAIRNLQAKTTLLPVPVFQKLERVKGDWNGIANRILELSATDNPTQPGVWLEVIYDGIEVIGDLRERLEAAISGTQMEILRIKNNRIIDRCLRQSHADETLDDLNVNDVFERCLAVHEVPEEQRPELLRAYQETVSSLYEDNVQAQ
ncbi:MAG: exonuclease SbcCD subunit D C-terminal domain-containing protein, partial [Deltaproteobacteria bacterium]|nr:exonuclease SbcCD subunit D C-terminal domain-containing protein [Deltaproteobacteria bacterium]